MQVKLSTLRKTKMATLRDDRMRKTKRLQKSKINIKYLLKIIHLNEYCLEHIFYELDLLDLARVADTNTHLSRVAANVFVQKYQNQEIQIKCYQNFNNANNYGRIPFNEARMIIEHFGKYIKKLDIDIGRWGDAERIVNVISKYCSKTLLELKFGNFRNQLQFQKPFIKLEKLAFYHSFFRFWRPFNQISTLFPNIRSIELLNVRYAFKSIGLEQHIPTLEHFGYYTFPYVKFADEDLQSIHRIVQLNPQLKSFGTYLSENGMSIDGMTVDTSMKPMPGIEIIDATCGYPMAGGPFHFANIKHVKLNGYYALNRGWLEITHQIEQLELAACVIDENMANFIVSCRNMKKLKITIAENFDMEHIKHIAKHLPLIDEVHFSVYKHNSELKHTSAMTAVVEFMRHCKQLNRAIVAHDVVKRTESHSKYKHSNYVKSKQIIKSYRDTINRNLPSSLQWRIKHELIPTDLTKGFEGFHSYLFFQVSFEKYGLSTA